MSRGLKLAVIIILPLTVLAFVGWILTPFFFSSPLEATVLPFTPDPAKGQMGMIKRIHVRNTTRHPVLARVDQLEGTGSSGRGGKCAFTATLIESSRPPDPFSDVVLLEAGESMTVGLISSEDIALESYNSRLTYVWTPATKSAVMQWYTTLRSEWPAFLVRLTPEGTDERKATCPVKFP